MAKKNTFEKLEKEINQGKIIVLIWNDKNKSFRLEGIFESKQDIAKAFKKKWKDYACLPKMLCVSMEGLRWFAKNALC